MERNLVSKWRSSASDSKDEVYVLLNDGEYVALSSPEDTGDKSFGPPSKRARGRPSVKGASKINMEWTDCETKALIELWSKESVLYHSKHPGFAVKEEKVKAMSRIIEGLFEKHSLRLDMDQLIAKMASLRCYYSREKNKEKSSETNGTGDIYISSWKFNQDLSFLADKIIPRRNKQDMVVPPTHPSLNSTQSPSFLSNTENKDDVARKSSRVKKVWERDDASSICDSDEWAPVSTGFTRTKTCKTKDLEQSTKPIEFKSTSKTPDQSYCDMLLNILENIPEGEMKDFVKLDVHKRLLDAKYGR